MRAGLSTIQQTLTPEAASVLNHSIAEASRRNHGQTTPLHVAATLLASPSGFLRQACIKSHPNSSHPLQCRALELCFSVALERLPTAQNASPGVDPPISNALMAALKRAQAHQRRGCPEQQQQPLLAVKVELEQLIISILDDPSVSRVMREASFSSPAVKATIEQTLNSTSSMSGNNNNNSSSNSSSIGGLGFRQLGRNLYMNPRLHQQQGSGIQSGQQRNEEIKRVIDIFLRNKKRNPVLVGEPEPETLVKEILAKIEGKELEGVLKNIEVIRLNKEFVSSKSEIASRLRELGGMVEGKIGNNSNNGGVVVDLGDLKWLVEQQQVGLGSAAGNSGATAVAEAVAEMGKMVVRFGSEGSGGKLWLIGTATCETYLRCQIYHPSMENDWDLQTVSIAAKSPLPGLFPRLGGNGILGTSLQSLSPLKAFSPDPAAATAVPPRRISDNLDPTRRTGCCPQCAQSCEQELETLKDMEKSKSSSELKSDAAKPPLPQWLQTAAVDQTPSNKDDDLKWKQKSQELQKKWTDMCMRLHPSFHHGPERILPTSFPMMTSSYNPNLLNRQPFQPKLQLNRINIGDTPRLQNPNLSSTQPLPSERVFSPPNSPVRTELVLGRSKVNESRSLPEKITRNDRVRDFLGCINSTPQNKAVDAVDADSFKQLLKGLAEKVWWQGEAASTVATTVTQCKLGNGKRRAGTLKGDIWLLFTGPDSVGKKKMALALSELVCQSQPVVVSFGSSRHDNGEQSDMTHFRGKTALDRIGDAVRRNPFSVILLEDIDEADMLVRGSIKRAMEKGRLSDSHGREISLGNVIFILTANWLPDSLKFLSQGINLDEKKLARLAGENWQLRLSVSGKTGKRRVSWLDDEQRHAKPRKEFGPSLSFDLNKAADLGDDNKADGSLNSSDLTIDHDDQENGLSNRLLLSPPSSTPPSKEMVKSVDDTVIFKPVDLGPVRRDATNAITKKFSSIIGSGLSIEIHDEALERIVIGSWLGRTSLDEWTEKVLAPSFQQLKSQLPESDESTIVIRLEADRNPVGLGNNGELLPSGINIVADEL